MKNNIKPSLEVALRIYKIKQQAPGQRQFPPVYTTTLFTQQYDGEGQVTQSDGSTKGGRCWKHDQDAGPQAPSSPNARPCDWLKYGYPPPMGP